MLLSLASRTVTFGSVAKILKSSGFCTRQREQQSGGQASDYSQQKLLRIYREKSASAGRNRIYQRLLRLYADSEINVPAVTEMK